MDKKLVPIQAWQLQLCRQLDLFYRTHANAFALYKKSGIDISQLRVSGGHHPQLYVKSTSLNELKEMAHRAMAIKLQQCLSQGDPIQIKDTLLFVMEQMLDEPRGGNLTVCISIAEKLLKFFVDSENVVKNLQLICGSGYTTAMHSVSVMSFTMGLCMFRGHNEEEIRQLSLASLLHDVGKSKIPKSILEAPRLLSDAERAIIQKHVNHGVEILSGNCQLMNSICPLTAEHHEKLDGSGYPNGIKKISLGGQIMAVLDIYDALTNRRPYRNSLKPFDALSVIGDEVRQGRLNRDVYQSLVLSLGAQSFT